MPLVSTERHRHAYGRGFTFLVTHRDGSTETFRNDDWLLLYAYDATGDRIDRLIVRDPKQQYRAADREFRHDQGDVILMAVEGKFIHERDPSAVYVCGSEGTTTQENSEHFFKKYYGARS